MQPTMQQVIPVSLFEGPVSAGGSVTVDLDDTYDHVLDSVACVPTGATAGAMTIEDSESHYVFGGAVASTGTSFTQLGIVLQSEASIKVTCVSAQHVKISAFRLAPSANDIFA